MLTDALGGPVKGHAHEVVLDDTFDYLNTLEYEHGFPVEHLETLGTALDWFVQRGVIHQEGADRLRTEADTDPAAADRDLARVRAVRDALRDVAEAIVE